MSRYMRGSVDELLTIAALATKDVVLAIFDQAVKDRTLISSLVATWSIAEWTPTANAGPIMVGVSHSDYTAAEIEEWIESTGSWNEGDLVQQEVANRKIRQVGVFQQMGNLLSDSVLNDGKPIKTKLKWILLEDQTLNLWAYNMGGSSVATTTPDVQCMGHANLFAQ